jgi:DNA topoisomerase-1
MPKKPKKTRAEKTVENYFPVNESDLRYTTEKIEKERPSKREILKKSLEIPIKDHVKQIKTIEKKYNKQDKKSLEIKGGSIKGSSKRKITKQEKYILPRIKEKGYELIITEKPQAASKIASALGKPVQKIHQKIPYYEVNRKGKKLYIACAAGHLFTLKQTTKSPQIPTFDIAWTPNFIAKKNDFTKRYHDTLQMLAKNAGSITIATDFDVEGELIGLNIARFICSQKNANRMKFSTLTPKELDQSYEKKLPSIEWGLAIAGETRHYLDWFYGINLSRALMNAIKTTGKFRIMSIGRIQGPTLNLIVEKEKEIQKFKPTSYWQIFITIEKPKIQLKYAKDIINKSELEKFKDLIGKKVLVETKTTEQSLAPNPPFNLTTLQTEAYKLYGITPSNTLKIAQSLYLSGLISYPRTSSQKLPDTIDYKSILDILKIRYKVAKLITKEKPVEGKKTDPAHPSIYPVGNHQVLSGNEEKIYNLIVKRFLALFCDDAIIEKKKITAKRNNFIFSINGSTIKKKSWLEFYPSNIKENNIPEINGELTITDKKTEEKETQPPKRYSPASIISKLEKHNLGTKTTRSAILETLYDRGYVKEKSIEKRWEKSKNQQKIFKKKRKR